MCLSEEGGGMRAKYLTVYQKKGYVEKGGTWCPFCGSMNIVAQEPFLADANQAWRTVRCLTPLCEQAWREVYTLTEIEDLRSRHPRREL